MYRIVPDTASPEQHLSLLFSDPQRYRPEACAVCGFSRLWAHGTYTRKSDRAPHGEGRRNPIPIGRFLCRNAACGRTCSRFPRCIPPRRWYPWAVQQALLLLVLTGSSLRAAARHFAPLRGPARPVRAPGRWRRWREEAPPRWL